MAALQGGATTDDMSSYPGSERGWGSPDEELSDGEGAPGAAVGSPARVDAGACRAGHHPASAHSAGQGAPASSNFFQVRLLRGVQGRC
jgi:hypothetical protein